MNVTYHPETGYRTVFIENTLGTKISKLCTDPKHIADMRRLPMLSNATIGFIMDAYEQWIIEIYNLTDAQRWDSN